MLPELTIPPSLAGLLAALRPCFGTAPTFATFCALVCGMLAQTGRRTVTGMLVGSGLSALWSHHRAHRFFSRVVWSAEQLGVLLAGLVVRLLVPADAAVTVVIDDTLFRRTGRKVWCIGWFHDGSVKAARQVGLGNNWVIAGIVVSLPMTDRPVCLPVLARLVRKNTVSGSRLWLAAQMVTALAEALPGRRIHVVADAAYAGKELRGLPEQVSWTTRLRKDAALYQPAPPRTGRRGRPRKKGNRLPSLSTLARTATFTPATVLRYGQTSTVYLASARCLWYSVFGAQQVTVVLLREDADSTGYALALVSTDLQATAGQIVERYAARWSVEVAIYEAKQLVGVGQARNRVAAAVERTVPFGLACQTLAVCWYATAGHHPNDVTEHQTRAPWYRTKTHPSTADMLAKLRRVLIATRFRCARPDQPTPAEIQAIRLAWENPAA
jgi:DDE superfamily endonuclease